MHLELFHRYKHSFVQPEQAFLALSLITLKHARLEGLKYLYISTCLLVRISDCDLWDKAWNDTLAWMLFGEAG